MTWLSWRQLRAQVAVAVLAVLACVVTLGVTGRRLHELAASSAQIYDLMRPSDQTLWVAGVVVVAGVPALVGMFWGAPMVARELEAGTHRLVWNQGVTRARWLTTKLGLTTGATVVVVGALTAAVTWWAAPLDGTTSRTQGGLSGRLTPVAFAMRGIVPVAYAVLALLLGVALGLVIRRTVPAMALTLLVFAALQIAFPIWVRPVLANPVHLVVALTDRPLDNVTLDHPGGTVTIGLAGSRGDWVLVNRTVGRDGQPAALPAWFSTCADGAPGSVSTAHVSSDSCVGRLAAEGYRQEMVAVPAGSFRRLQAVESAVYLALAGVLAGFCFWWLRRTEG